MNWILNCLWRVYAFFRPNDPIVVIEKEADWLAKETEAAIRAKRVESYDELRGRLDSVGRELEKMRKRSK